jgi:hypothetical protein
MVTEISEYEAPPATVCQGVLLHGVELRQFSLASPFKKVPVDTPENTVRGGARQQLEACAGGIHREHLLILQREQK